MKTKHCLWWYDGDITSYETSCNQCWTFIEGTYKENNVKYCPYCGNPIKEVKQEKALEGKP